MKLKHGHGQRADDNDDDVGWLEVLSSQCSVDGQTKPKPKTICSLQLASSRVG